MAGIIFCFLIFAAVWSEGRKQIRFQRPAGLLFAEWLIFAGLAWIALAGLFHANSTQVIRSILLAVPLLATGAILISVVVPPFLKKYEGLRILERVGGDEQFTQAEYTAPNARVSPPGALADA